MLVLAVAVSGILLDLASTAIHVPSSTSASTAAALTMGYRPVRELARDR